MGQQNWTETFTNNRNLLIQVILDPSVLCMEKNISRETLMKLENAGRELCYSLHANRVLLHKQLQNQ